MRIRCTKPEFWRSRTIAQLDWSDRFVLKGLEAYVDDNGVGKDDIELIASDVFPRDLSRSPDTLARLAEAISRIASTGLVIRYTHNGERLLYVDRWKEIQRIDKPGKGRFPRPDGTLEYSEPVSRESYQKSRESVAPGTGEQGNRGTGETRTPVRTEQQSATRPDGRGKALDKFREANLTARSAGAYRIAEAFSASLSVPIESGMLAEIGTQIDKCLRSDIPPPAIAEGLKAWTSSDSWSPTQIPKFVHKANNRATNGKPTAKAMGYDQALAELLEEVQTL